MQNILSIAFSYLLLVMRIEYHNFCGYLELLPEGSTYYGGVISLSFRSSVPKSSL
jgi:hypothetical protein